MQGKVYACLETKGTYSLIGEDSYSYIVFTDRKKTIISKEFNCAKHEYMSFPPKLDIELGKPLPAAICLYVKIRFTCSHDIICNESEMREPGIS